MLSILLTIALMAANPAGTLSGSDLLQRGKDNFRAAQYAHAVDDLRAAADSLLSAEQKQAYVATGHLETLPQLEEALVYLTVAYAKLGRDDDARETLSRLAAAERIESHYATLPLTADVADFPAVASRLQPQLQLPPNPQLASAAPFVPQPVPAPMPAPAPAPVPAPAPTAVAAQTPAPMSASDREAIMAEVERRVAEARAQIERQMAEQLAAARRDMERQIDERVAAAIAATQREAERRIAAAEARSKVDVLATLRRADILANTGRLAEANEIYLSIANATAATRESITEAAVGLYRTGSFADAAKAFSRLGTFARGEEDLRYYYAVSLFETGQVDQAGHELACALPYLELSDAIRNYQSKIEAAAARQARR